MAQKTWTLILPAGSKAAGAQLYMQSWIPQSPKAVILVAHGYAEHLGRYEHVAQRFLLEGFAVYAIDHWGHGRSDGVRGHVPAFSVFTDGMAALLNHVDAAHPGLPKLLIGHSMGGLIAAHHLLTHQASYRAALLSGPAVEPGTPPPALVRIIGQILARIAPKAGIIQLEADAVSRDPAVVAAYLADPLVHKGKMSARLAAEMLRAMEALQSAAQRIHLPMLIMHGSEDRLASPAGAQGLIDRLGSENKEFRLLTGLYHEIFNEPERDAVLDDALRWLTAQIA